MALSGARIGANLANGVMTPEKWSTLLLADFLTLSVVPAISNTDYQGEISEGTDKVIIRTTPDVAVVPYIMGQDLEIPALAMGSVELKIDQQDTYIFALENIDVHQSNLALAKKIVEKAVYKVQDTVDARVLQTVPASIPLANTVGTSIGSATPTQITTANALKPLMDSGQVLDDNKVPRDGNRFAVISPYYANILKQSPLAQAYFTGDTTSPVRNGQIGNIDGMDVYVSTNLLNGRGALVGTPTNCLVGHKDAITFASQFMQHSSTLMERRHAMLYKGLNVWGFKVLKAEALALPLIY